MSTWNDWHEKEARDRAYEMRQEQEERFLPYEPPEEQDDAQDETASKHSTASDATGGTSR